MKTWACNSIQADHSKGGCVSCLNLINRLPTTIRPTFPKVVSLASDQVAVERACRLIDKYIAEKWQAPYN